MNGVFQPAGLLLLPGLLCDGDLWAHQVRHLADVAAVQVADLTGQDSIGAMAQAVLATAPPRFALAGLSMGGYVAFEILRQAPERVTRLCLLDTTARPDTPEQSERRRALVLAARTGRFATVLPHMLPNLVHPERLRDASLMQTITDMAKRVGAEAFCRQQTAIIGRTDSRPGLSAISVPTLCIVGRDDALTPPDRAEEMASAIPGAKLAPVERCGHCAPLEQPEAVTALMRLWLTQL
ncbi:alpha/beta fold hydrolase [Oleisolibacter albus]|uniref:alpha/beta fold hydrolase n=1 Tax=Oleisolibacter albus TaxID=2171757 RepID=UPI000DF32DA1|nr:alpha/beta fold hydrolase [Oleisolibacter albus]